MLTNSHCDQSPKQTIAQDNKIKTLYNGLNKNPDSVLMIMYKVGPTSPVFKYKHLSNRYVWFDDKNCKANALKKT